MRRFFSGFTSATKDDTANDEVAFWKADFDKEEIGGFGGFASMLGLSDNSATFHDFFHAFANPKNVEDNFLKIKQLECADSDFSTRRDIGRRIRICAIDYDSSRKVGWGYIAKNSQASNLFDAKKAQYSQMLVQTIEKLLYAIKNGITDWTISDILRDIMQTNNADRVSLMKYNHQDKTISCTHEVCVNGIATRLNIVKNIPLRVVAWLDQELNNHKYLITNDFNSSSDEMLTTSEVLACQDNRTTVFHQVRHNQTIVGFICVEYISKECKLSSLEIKRISYGADVLAFATNEIEKKKKFDSQSDYLSSLRANLPIAYMRLELVYQDNALANYRYLDVNAEYEKMFKTKREALVGKTATDVIPDDYTMFLQMFGDTVRSGEAQRFKKYYQRIGKIIDIVIFMPNFNEISCLIIDPTSLQNYGMFSETDESVIKNFVHGIRTQLNAILGFSELMAEATEASDKAKYLEIIKENSDNLLDMTYVMDKVSTKEVNDNNMETSENKRPVILVAEDTESNYILVSYILKKDYEIIWARDGVEAIEKYESEHPDLILMDVRMPRLGGLAATAHIRETDKKIPIIALTAFAFDSDKAKTMEAGCTDFLSKPIQAATLRSTVQKYL